MNKPVIVVALVLACTFSCNGASPDMKAVVDECKKEHDVESGVLRKLIHQLPGMRHGKCFMSCVMNKTGVIKDGKVDLDTTMEIIKMKFKDPENLEKANEIAKKCASVESSDSEECSYARELAKCAFENAIKLKLELPKEEV